MGSKKPPDDSSGTNIINSPGGMSFDKNRKLINETPGEKFLIMKRIEKDESMEGVSPFHITKAIEGIAQGRVEKVTWLRNGTVFIKTVNLKQAKQLIKMAALIPNIKIDISEHPRLNSSKGVIITRLLSSVSDDEFLSEMAEQNVIGIHRIKKNFNGVERDSGVYFITFSTCEPPKSIKICYENLEVRN